MTSHATTATAKTINTMARIKVFVGTVVMICSYGVLSAGRRQAKKQFE
jgi:hypothetical protein